MNIRNDDVESVAVRVPEGHAHLRTTITLRDGTELTLQEATVANIVRAYVTVKTHPLRTGVTLKGRELEGGKKGYARWQLLEEEER